jgi:Flp pilus assembly protein TadG
MNYIYIPLLFPFLLLCSCGVFDTGQVELAMQVISQMESAGTVTATQAAALREALAANTGDPWYFQVGRVVLEVALAIAGVRLWRGPAASAAERVARVAARAAN